MKFIVMNSIAPAMFVYKKWYAAIKSDPSGIATSAKIYATYASTIAQLRWARLNGCPITADALSEYAAQGRLDLIQCAFKIGVQSFNFDSMMSRAAFHGHVDVVNWTFSHSVNKDTDDWCAIARTCSVNELMGILTPYFDLDKNAAMLLGYAVEGDNNKIVEYLCGRGYIDRGSDAWDRLKQLALDGHRIKVFLSMCEDDEHNSPENAFRLIFESTSDEERDLVWYSLRLDSTVDHAPFTCFVTTLIAERSTDTLQWLIRKLGESKVKSAANLCASDMMKSTFSKID